MPANNLFTSCQRTKRSKTAEPAQSHRGYEGRLPPIELTSVRPLLDSTSDVCRFVLIVRQIEEGHQFHKEHPRRLLCEGAKGFKINVKAFGANIDERFSKIRVNDVVSFERMIIAPSDPKFNQGSLSPITLLHERCGKIRIADPKESLTSLLDVLYLCTGPYRVFIQKIDKNGRVGHKKIRFTCCGKDASIDVHCYGDAGAYFWEQIMANQLREGSVVELYGLTIVPQQKKILPVIRQRQGSIIAFSMNECIFYNPARANDHSNVTLTVEPLGT